MQKGVANFMMFDFVQRKNLRMRRHTPAFPTNSLSTQARVALLLALLPAPAAIIRKRQNFYFKFKLTFWLARR